MVEAKPNLSNKKGIKVFKTVTEAVDYRNEITGFPMDAESWRLIGKLRLIRQWRVMVKGIDLFRKKPNLPRVVVRLKTTQWADKRGNIHEKRSLLALKRQGYGHNYLLEDFSNAGEITLVNLAECPDGIYKVIVCNESYDREGGWLDDWDLKLVPYAICPATGES